MNYLKIKLGNLIKVISILILFHSTAIYPEKKVVLILGMHRSGTSATAGFLHSLGLKLGNKLLIPDQNNEKGYFEDLATNTLNNYILEKVLNSSWDDIYPLDFKYNSEKIVEIKNIIKEHLRKNFEGYDLFALKDPRISILLPLYLDVFKEMNYVIKIIIVTRNIHEIAVSLEKRDEMPLEKAQILINKYLDSIYKYSIDYNKITIDFDDLLNNTYSIIEKIKDFLSELEITPDKIKKALDFLDKSLKHHNFKQ